MERHALLILLFMSLIVFDSSNAFSVRELRKLVTSDPKDNKTQDPQPKKPDPNPVGETNKVKGGSPSSTNNNVSPTPQPHPSTNVENGNDGKKGGTNNNNSAPPVSAPLVPKKSGDEKDQGQNKGKIEGASFTHLTTTETCDGRNFCTDGGDMRACISKNVLKYLVVLLQNRGDVTIKVKLHTDFENNLGDLEVEKNKTEKINIKLSSSKSTQLTLSAGKRDCVLHMVTHIPEGNFFLRLPTYDQILTPVNGAYLLILTVIVFGGTWACCMFRKKRHDGVPYQELEMAMPESASATNVESAEGWDQGWDDDWDDNVAVKSPPAHLAGSISANGLTSRSSNKDGWENDWDD